MTRKSRKLKCACVILSAVTLTMFLTGIKANTTESAPTKQFSEESVSKLPEWDESGILEEKQKEYRQQALQDELTQRQQEAQKWLADRHIEVPENIKAICKAKEEQYDISATFLEALIYEESRFHVDAANGPCRGLCQVNIRFYPHNWKDPEANIDAACQVIMSIIEQNGAEDMAEITSLYHGEGHGGYSHYTQDIDELSVKLMESEGVY